MGWRRLRQAAAKPLLPMPQPQPGQSSKQWQLTSRLHSRHVRSRYRHRGCYWRPEDNCSGFMTSGASRRGDTQAADLRWTSYGISDRMRQPFMGFITWCMSGQSCVASFNCLMVEGLDFSLK